MDLSRLVRIQLKQSGEPCVGPKQRMRLIEMETIIALLGQRYRYPTDAYDVASGRTQNGYRS